MNSSSSWSIWEGMRNRQCVILAFLVFTPLWVFASDPVPANRLPYDGTWGGIVGVSGGIPNVTTIYTNLNTSATVSQINTALANCPSNEVVQLASGTYNLSGTINIAKSGVVLRGATSANGQPATILNGTAIFMCGGGTWDIADTTKWSSPVNITSGATRGSSNVVLASSISGLKVGGLMWIAAPQNSVLVGGNWALFLGAYPYSKCVQVTAIAGTTITFWPPINADYLTNCVAVIPTSGVTIYRSGAENLYMTTSGGADPWYLEMQGTDECWAKNITTYDSAYYHMELYLAFRSEIRHCDMSHMESYGSSTYCIMSADSSSWLIEDNYFHDVPNVMPMFGAVGCAFSYNLVTNVPYATAGWLSQMVFFHGGHNCYNLFEGNIMPSHWHDGYPSNQGQPTGSRNNIDFRDRLVGWDGSDGGKIYNCECLTLNSNNVNYVVAGCVLGKPGFSTVYSGYESENPPGTIFNIDNSVANSFLPIDNYNTADGGVHSSEALSTGQALVASYLYSSKPSWFGNLNWPPIDPTQPAYSMSITNIPAGYRLVYGIDPPAGSVVVPAPVQGFHIVTNSPSGG